ncbi:hypothetical protein OsccyDRAFT_2001 [Leptolyngbyaceae cyanobacterium JSC-12]|nr:hypothetical protein OsccyDRAFT_2001 [Leptolyngbyaceae cyanobacterium JSC-12]
MRQGSEQGFGQDYERCFDELNRAIEQLGGKADPAQISMTAELIIQTMSGPWRYFHTPEHIFEVGESGDAIEVLSALFHDLVYVQVDQVVSVNTSRYIAPFVKEIGGQLVILERWQLPNDPLFEMVSQIFGFTPGQTLLPTAGQNEFLSAVIAAKSLEHALSPAVIAQITACIEATIPFRPISPTGQTVGDRLFDRLSQVNANFDLGWTEADIHAIVKRAIRLANRDIENFAYEASAEFLDNTWNLMPETNHDLTSANAYTVSGYRLSLQKMEGFMNFLKPELVFQRYQDEPDPELYQILICRTQKNLEVARLYLGSKLLSIAVIEALSQRIGQDIPLATMMGELPGRGLAVAQLENFLPNMEVSIPPANAIEQEVLELLEKGRTKSSTYDVKNSPVATFIIKSIGFPEARRLLLQAKEFFKRSISAEEFLALCDREVVDTIVRAVLQVFEYRKNAMAGRINAEVKV